MRLELLKKGKLISFFLGLVAMVSLLTVWNSSQPTRLRDYKAALYCDDSAAVTEHPMAALHRSMANCATAPHLNEVATPGIGLLLIDSAIKFLTILIFWATRDLAQYLLLNRRWQVPQILDTLVMTVRDKFKLITVIIWAVFVLLVRF